MGVKNLPSLPRGPEGGALGAQVGALWKDVSDFAELSERSEWDQDGGLHAHGDAEGGAGALALPVDGEWARAGERRGGETRAAEGRASAVADVAGSARALVAGRSGGGGEAEGGGGEVAHRAWALAEAGKRGAVGGQVQGLCEGEE